MADCVSNAAELVESLRQEAKTEVYDTAMLLLTAADAIEALLAENAKLQAERDAAVALLKEEGYCYSCKQCTERDGNECWCAALGDWSEWYDGCDAWEWRGVTDTNVGSKKEEEDGKIH